MLLLGLYYSKDKPMMNMYLRPIISDIQHLFKEGEFVYFCVVIAYPE